MTNIACLTHVHVCGRHARCNSLHPSSRSTKMPSAAFEGLCKLTPWGYSAAAAHCLLHKTLIAVQVKLYQCPADISCYNATTQARQFTTGSELSRRQHRGSVAAAASSTLHVPAQTSCNYIRVSAATQQHAAGCTMLCSLLQFVGGPVALLVIGNCNRVVTAICMHVGSCWHTYAARQQEKQTNTSKQSWSTRLPPST